jgi:hypothetical protein
MATDPADLYVVRVDQEDVRLGRQVVHDPASRGFTAPRTAIPLRSKRHRVYDPYPNPNQPVGCCTGVAEAVMGNTVGNRVTGQVLGMPVALDLYRFASRNDPWPGAWEPTDTGSSGLAAAKGAVRAGLATHYEWYFGVTAILNGLMTRPISVGAWWYESMFYPNPDTLLVRPDGPRAGGHQWTLVAYDHYRQEVEGVCWWGEFRRFRMTVADFGALVEDDGDAHTTYRRAA